MADEPTLSPAHAQGQQLAEQGNYAEALTCLTGHLAEHPEDGAALNDMGIILYALGQLDEAADYLRRAMTHLRRPPTETQLNLTEVLLAAGKPDQAADLLGPLAEAGVLTADLAARVATSLLDRQQLGHAVEVLLLSVEHMPEQQVIAPILEQVVAKRPHVGVFFEPAQGTDLQELVAWLAKRYPLRCQPGPNGPELFETAQWCDVAITTENDLDLGDARDLPRLTVSPGDVHIDRINAQLIDYENRRRGLTPAEPSPPENPVTGA
jgi:tetratricopeptide (TPR) repeat protein